MDEMTDQEVKDRADVEAEVFGTEPDEIQPDPEPEAQATPDEPAPEDPWAGVAPALKEQFDALQAKASAVDGVLERLKQAERRIGSMSNELHVAREAAKAVENGPTQKQVAAAAKAGEKWEKLKDEFPEFADALHERLSGIEPPKVDMSTYETRLNAEIAKAKAETERAIELRLLRRNHPDWEDVVKAPQYQTWIASQPQEVQVKARSANADDAIDVLDRFKASTSTGKPSATDIARQRTQRLEQSQTQKTGKRLVPSKSLDEMSDQELRDYYSRKIWAA